MCGIFALLNNYDINTIDNINCQFKKGSSRGPEYSKLISYNNNCLFGFHRLAINGLNDESNQPLVFNDIILICNGEIYNYKQLYEYMNIKSTTDSDCEVIIHLYLKYGIEQTLTMLDGVFAFLLYDNRSELINKRMYIARDPFGVRPLYKLYNYKSKSYNLYDFFKLNMFNNCELFAFASEIKCLEYFYNSNKKYCNIQQFEPGTYSLMEFSLDEISKWEPKIDNKKYFIPSLSHTILYNTTSILNINDQTLKNISTLLNDAVVKRCITTDRPVACLLSGGLDSSLIAALVANYFTEKNIRIETYSIGLKNSEDIKYAKNVADYINSNHTEIIVTEDDMFNAIPEVIKALESYDTTTVRASLGNYLLGKYISQNSECKVIFNGDGSDELFGGYLYMSKCPDDIEFDKETRRLLNDIYLFDVLRSDKSISSNGLEPRTPFLDRSFVNYILTIPTYFRNHTNFNKCEKYLLRESFQKENFQNYNESCILPHEILYRKKEAFSDGVSSQGRSLYQILQEKIAEKLNNDILDENNKYKANIDTEKYYYKKIFDEYYPNCSHILPYFWMPKYTNATDPSARTLNFYTDV
jgi:asparagine synthase (glutamine-hydrolysing)